MNLRGVDLNLLTVFEAVYEERSQVRASERLGMTQPAVSQALARLRHLLGDPLFRGRTRGLVPTPRADRVYAEIHRVLDGVRKVLTESREFQPSVSGRSFAVGISPTLGIYHGPLLYERMRREAPNTRLRIRTIDPEEQMPGLLREHRLDLAIRHGRFDDPALEQPLFSEDELVIMVRSGHPRIQEPPTLEACLAERFVCPINLLERAHDAALNNFMEDIRERTVLEVTSPLVIAHAFDQSDLLVLTHRRLAERFGDIQGVRYYRLPIDVPPLRSHLIWHREMSDDPGHRWLRGQLRAVLEDS
jgi:DNA-binding transcriptional LysR family regulator